MQEDRKHKILLVFLFFIDFLRRLSSSSTPSESTNLNRLSGCGPEGEYLGTKTVIKLLLHCCSLLCIHKTVHLEAGLLGEC